MRDAEDKRAAEAAQNKAAQIVNSTETWYCPGCDKEMALCAKCGKHHCDQAELERHQRELEQEQLREAEDKRRRAAEEDEKRHQRKIEELKASNEAKAKAVIVNSTETWYCPACGKEMALCAQCGKHHCDQAELEQFLLSKSLQQRGKVFNER
jgi:predicted RNA-binding Zn-ribbon protein involved in translation (DUF1610 family)